VADPGTITFAPGATTLDDMERKAIVRTLERYEGHRQRTADALGIGVRTLGIKLKRWKDEHLVPEDL
jgi:DNA-binding NtrC family response regulator